MSDTESDYYCVSFHNRSLVFLRHNDWRCISALAVRPL